jgi:hypothetical protein
MRTEFSLAMIAAVAALGLVLEGCAGAPVAGALYTNIDYGNQATANAAGTRMGEACGYLYAGLVAVGDSSVETARRNGGISQITSVDHSTFSVLAVIYNKHCTIVRGR